MKSIRKLYYRFLLWWHVIPWICSKHLIEKKWVHVGDGDWGYLCLKCNNVDEVKKQVQDKGAKLIETWRERLSRVA